jgi:hypothetical protein
MQNLFSVLSICLSGLMLLFVGPVLWLMWFQTHHRFCITIPGLIAGLLRYTDTLGFPILSQTTRQRGAPTSVFEVML